MPPEFVIPFKVDDITRTPAEGLQRQYQLVKGPKEDRTYYWLSTTPAGAETYGNFANCALTKYTKQQKTYKGKMWRETQQDMTVAHCGLVWNDNEGSTSELIKECPAYLLLNRNDKKDKVRYVNYEKKLITGYEILVDQRYGGGHTIG